MAHPHFTGAARVRIVLIAAVAFLLYVGLGVPAIEVLLVVGVVDAFLPPVRA